jgi:dihydroorotase
LRYTRNDLLVGGVRPHLYCLPILKAEAHRTALRGAMLSGDPRFFAGTDSAPHWRHLKEASCGCAGVYHGEAWLAHYASIYDRSADLSDPLHQEGFTRFLVDHSLMFYGWERPRGRVRLTRRPQSIPLWVGHDEAMVVPMGAGETLDWTAEVCRD